MTIDTKNLRTLAEDCMQREIDFDDVSPNQGSTSCDKLTRAYFRDANPAAILALLDALERKDALLKQLGSKLIDIRVDLEIGIGGTETAQHFCEVPKSMRGVVDKAIEAITKELTP